MDGSLHKAVQELTSKSVIGKFVILHKALNVSNYSWANRLKTTHPIDRQYLNPHMHGTMNEYVQARYSQYGLANEALQQSMLLP